MSICKAVRGDTDAFTPPLPEDLRYVPEDFANESSGSLSETMR